jgi:hypothetical protein
VSIRAARIPDAPINLSNVPEVTTAYQIGLSWNESPYDGGSPVIDFMLNYKDETQETFSVF